MPKLNNTMGAALRHVTSGSGGRTYENLMSEAMGAYCVRNDIPFKAVTGTDEDLFGGTDFRIYGMLDILTADSGILRLDFTSDFSNKDNMPVVYKPEQPFASSCGHYLSMGIRTGNKSRGFEYPVIVVGFDALNNPNPDRNVDIDLVAAKLQCDAARQAPAILSAAGSALHEYVRKTRPEYAAWLLSEEAMSEDLVLPDEDALVPNYDYDFARSPQTYKPSAETIRGLKLAKDLAYEAAFRTVAGTHEHESAKLFALQMSEAANIRPAGREKARNDARPKDWLKILNKASQELRSRDRSDGLSK